MQDDLELVIDEPTKGHFYWVISTRATTTTAATVVDCAKGPLPTHMAATNAGTSALRCHRSLKCDANAPYSEFRADWYAETVPAALM